MDTVMAPPATFCGSTIAVRTEVARGFVDITPDVARIVHDSHVQTGLVLVASQHTTAAIVVNEHEPELLKDLDAFLHRLAPESGPYLHNDVPCEPGEGPNGHAHCQALLLSASTSIPVAAGSMSLGRWQRIFLVELDRPRARRLSVVVIGS
jgi:secondary thiamine-phosphate synthase enzyme